MRIFKYCKMYEVPVSLRFTIRNVIIAKLAVLEAEIDSISYEMQRVNEWNCLLYDLRVILDFVEQLRLLPVYQISKYKHLADELEKKGDAAMILST